MSEVAAKGCLFIISGPSGVGKSTLVQRLLKSDPSLTFSISCTTRPQRPRERDGVNYHFISNGQFQKMVREHQFLEYAEYNGNWYGTPLAPLQQWVAQGKKVILEIEVQGARQLQAQRETLPIPMCFIFILPPSKAQLKDRIQRRGTESAAKRESRLKIAEKELKEASWFDINIVNNTLEDAFAKLQRIIAQPGPA